MFYSFFYRHYNRHTKIETGWLELTASSIVAVDSDFDVELVDFFGSGEVGDSSASHTSNLGSSKSQKCETGRRPATSFADWFLPLQ